MNRAEKASSIEELQGRFSEAKFAVATDYRGLTVPVFQDLRKELKKNESEIKVAKNTLLRFAVKDTEYEALGEHFKGTTAVAFSYGDPVGPAKMLVDFAKSHSELAIKGAVLEGKSLSADDIVSLSKMPSKEVLIAQTLSTMQAVPTSFVRVLAGVPQKLVYLLQALKDNKEQTDN